MRETKFSGIEWVGDIPASWNVNPLFIYFDQRKSINRLGHENNLLSLSYGKIIRKDINTNEGLLPASFNTYNIVENGDIIIRPTDLQNDKHSLRTGLVKEHGIITSAYIAIKPIKHVNSSYFQYLLYAYDVKKVFYNMGNGVRQGINFSEFSRLKVIEPSLEEQNRIVTYLDSRLSLLDSIINDIKEEIQLLEQYKMSLISETITSGLKSNVEMTKSGCEWLNDVPASWNSKPIKYVLISRTGGAWGDDDDGSDNSRICLRIADFDYRTGRFKNTPIEFLTHRRYTGTQIANLQLVHGDILIEKSGGGEKTPVGRCVVFDKDYSSIFANFMERLRVNDFFVTPYYFEYWMKMMYSHRVTPFYINQTTGIQNLDMSSFLSNEKIFYPPIDEQNAIVDYLDAHCTQIDSLVDNKKRQIEALVEYESSIIYEYVTGKKEAPIL